MTDVPAAEVSAHASSPLPGADTSARCLIVAEVGSTPDGSVGNAVRLVEEAAAAGADAVKFQLHIAAEETTRDAPAPAWFTAERRYEYFERTAFSPAGWDRIVAACVAAGVEFLCSPFSEQAVDVLEDLGVARYKVASGEVTNTPLLHRIAQTGKQVLLSSGMSTWSELDLAVAVLGSYAVPVTVLQCTSEYPCPPERVGLNVLLEMRRRYGHPVGFSDHTSGNEAALVAVALGASVVEKHITISKRMYGSDAALAAEPEQFAVLAAGIRDVEAMLACTVDKDRVATLLAETKATFEKSVVAAVPLVAGTVLAREHLAFKKPGSGLPPSEVDLVLGRRLRRDVAADALLQVDDVEVV